MTPHKTPHILGHSNECSHECPAAVCPFLSNCDGVEQVYPLGRVELGPITPTERERGRCVGGVYWKATETFCKDLQVV